MNLTKIAIAGAALTLALLSAAPAAADVRRGPCGRLADPSDRRCYAVNDSAGPWIALHIRTHNGHDSAWTDGYVSDGGHLWMEVSHAGRTRTVSRMTAPRDGAGGQSLLGNYRMHVYDGPGYRVRACGDQANGSSHHVCTAWH